MTVASLANLHKRSEALSCCYVTSHWQARWVKKRRWKTHQSHLYSETQKKWAFFFRVSVANGRSESQAFLAETGETGDNNRDDFYCMQKSLVIRMRFTFDDD